MRSFLTALLLPTLTLSITLPTNTIYQFPTNPTWIENIAVRSNGNLLLTFLNSPDIVQVFQPINTTTTPVAKLAHRFTNLDGILGITETTPDTFVIVGGNFTGVTSSIPGTFSAWSIGFVKGKVSVNHIVDIPEAMLLNGAVALPWNQNIVLVAESFEGKLYRVNVAEKKYDLVLSGKELDPVAGAEFPLGINGVKFWGNELFFTSSSQRKIFKVRLDREGAVAAGAKVELVSSIPDVVFLDDFTFDKKGGIWVVTNMGNTLLYVGRDGKSEVVAGSVTELTVAGGTAAAFGRTGGDRDILYAVTNGAYAEPVNGTVTEAGKVVAVDTKGCKL